MNYMPILSFCLGLALVGCKGENSIAETPSKGSEGVQTSTHASSSAAPTAVSSTSPAKTPIRTGKPNAPATSKRETTEAASGTEPSELATTFETKMSQKALDFVENRWRVAREKGDIEAYAKLLTEDFKGSRLPLSLIHI